MGGGRGEGGGGWLMIGLKEVGTKKRKCSNLDNRLRCCLCASLVVGRLCSPSLSLSPSYRSKKAKPRLG